eukprot:3788075-Pleurochrysis_carterae.AAC.2
MHGLNGSGRSPAGLDLQVRISLRDFHTLSQPHSRLLSMPAFLLQRKGLPERERGGEVEGNFQGEHKHRTGVVLGC